MTKRKTPDEVVEAFASAVTLPEEQLREVLAKVFHVTAPEAYGSIVDFTQACIAGKIPRYHADPMLPGCTWAAWRCVYDAAKVWDKHFQIPRRRELA